MKVVVQLSKLNTMNNNMRTITGRLVATKNFCLLVCLTILFALKGYAQPNIPKLVVDKGLWLNGATFRDSSNITFPLVMNPKKDSFGIGNIFELWLLNSATVPTTASPTLPNRKIGNYNFGLGTYTTYVNGFIPSSALVPPGQYWVRVHATSPDVWSDSMLINVVSSPNARLTTNLKSLVDLNAGGGGIIYNDTLNNNLCDIFGWCGIQGSPISTLKLWDSTRNAKPGLNDSVIIVLNDGYNNVNSVVSRSAYNYRDTISVPLTQGNYYTLLLKSIDATGNVSAKSYFLLNPTWNILITSKDKPTGCTDFFIPQYFKFIIDPVSSGIGKNFPGLTYIVNFADPGVPVQEISYLKAVRDTFFSSVYYNSSCPNPNGEYLVKASLNNKFNNINGSCDFPQTSVKIRIFENTNAKIVIPKSACVGKKFFMDNQSQAGQGQNGNGCAGVADYTWILDGSVWSKSPGPLPTYSDSGLFTTVCKHVVKLVADNKSCRTDTAFDTIDVVKPPVLDFKLDTLTGCAPLTVKATNLSDSSGCGTTWNFSWQVFDSAGTNKAVYGTDWILPLGTIQDTSKPGYATDIQNIRLLQQGTWRIRLYGSNACTDARLFKDTLVRVIGLGGVSFPSNATLVNYNNFKYNFICGTGGSINFNAQTQYRPTYQGTAVGNPTWTVTNITAGGTGTANIITTNPQFPLINFANTTQNEDYNVVVDYTSTCGQSRDSIIVRFNKRITHTLSTSTKKICNSASNVFFTATLNIPTGSGSTLDSVSWDMRYPGGRPVRIYSAPGTPPNGNLFYSLTAQDRLQYQDSITFIFTSYQAQPNGCPTYVDSIKIKIDPPINQKDSTISICSNSSVNYNFNYITNASSVSWSGSLASGNVTGYSSGTSQTISDVLVNNSTSGGIAQYTVTATSATGCSSNPFNVFVSVLSTPTVTLKDASFKDTVCSNAPSSLLVSSSSSTFFDHQVFIYNPSKTSQSSGPVAGSPLSTPYTYNAVFNNVSSTIDSVLIIITPFNATTINAAGRCYGKKDTVKMYILPGPSPAIAGTDQYLCAANQTTLTGNVATKGIGCWSQYKPNGPGDPSALINNPCNNIVNPQALQVDKNYYFVYTVSLAGSACPASTDTVVVFVRDTVTKANAGNDTLICGYTPNTTIKVPLRGNKNLNKPYETGLWTIISNPNYPSNPSLLYFNSTLTTQSQLNNDTLTVNGPRGRYTLVWTLTNDAKNNGCGSKSDTVNIDLGIGNNFIYNAKLDTSICQGSFTDTIRGSLPSGGGNQNFTYSWGAIPTPIGWPGYTTKDLPPQNPSVTTTYVRYTTTNLCNLPAVRSSNFFKVIVYPNPKAKFNYITDTGCAPFALTAITNINVDSSVSFTDPSVVYSWFVNGTQKGSGRGFPSYIMPNSGQADTIKFLASSNQGCGADSQIHIFRTYLVPQPSFTANSPINCNSSQVCFTNTTPNRFDIKAFQWDLKNGSFDTSYNLPNCPLYLKSTTGNDTVYNVTLTASNACGVSNSFVLPIRVQSPPKPKFFATTTFGCAPLVDTFYQTTIGQVDSVRWVWGDGTTTLKTDTSFTVHTYNSSSTTVFPVKIYAYNKCGMDSAGPLVVQTSAAAVRLNITLPAVDRNACGPHTVNFANNSQGATTFVWDFGDGSGTLVTNDTIAIVPHLYTSPGIYVVKVTASNLCDTKIWQDTVRIYRTPVADFSLPTASLCLGDTIKPVNLTDTLVGLPVTWRFPAALAPNVPTANLTNPSVIFSGAGADSIKLIVYALYVNNTLTCSDTVAKPIQINSIQRGSFIPSIVSSNCLPDTVTFVNHSINQLTGYPVSAQSSTWKIFYPNTVLPVNPQVTFTQDSVQHIFTDTGTYRITMSMLSAGGCNYIDTQKIMLYGPTGTWKYDHGFICGKTPVRFEATAFNTAQYHWYFGNGFDTITTGLTGNVVYYSYPAAGIYYPTVVLISSSGCRDTLNWITGDTIKVDYIKAGFTYQVQQNCGNTVVNFTDTARAYFGFNSTSTKTWFYDFDDFPPGNLDSVQNPSHMFRFTGPYDVQQIVTGVSGCSDTTSVLLQIKVNDKPRITSHVIRPYNGVVGCTGQLVSYSGAASCLDSIRGYTWAFSNANPGTGTSASATYPAVGNYTDTFVVTSIFNCTDTFVGNINILQTPTVTISPNPVPEICRGQSTTLTASGAATYIWSPNPLCTNPPNCSVVVWTPLQDDGIVVTGTATNGCAAIDSVKVKVIQPFALLVTPLVDTICIGDSVKIQASGGTIYSWTPRNTTGDSTLSCDTCPVVIAKPLPPGKTYTVTATNQNCGQFAQTATVSIVVGDYPTVNLGQDLVVQTGSLVPFNPILTNGPFKQYAWTPSNNLSCNNCANPIATITGNDMYTLTATNIYGCSATDSLNVVTFCQNSQVYIPNTFTPDGDGLNDVFMVRASGIRQVKSFRIYNRWGQVVFERTNFAPNDPQYGWDGKIRNTNSYSPTDTYVYFVEVVCENETPFTYKGNVSLLR